MELLRNAHSRYPDAGTRRRAFTLIEIVLAVTILAIIMISVFQAYFGAVSLERRLDFSRSLQENARSMTEILAKDVRDSGLDATFYDGSTPERTLDYSQGNDVLAVIPNGTPVRYYLMRDGPSGVVKCDSPATEVCHLGRETLLPDGSSSRIRLSDDRVRVGDLRFFISGSPVDISSSSSATVPLEVKVTIRFELRIPESKGVDPYVLKEARINVQTTVAQKLYKAY